MASANPYLNFAGTCAEAFDFYQGVSAASSAM